MPRQNLEEQDPYKAPRPPAPRASRPKGPRTPGTFSNPYTRDDGVQTIKVAFRASVECAGMLKALAAKLEMEGIARNEWLEALILDGIRRGFVPPGKPHKKAKADEA